jgi:hypothetical protein
MIGTLAETNLGKQAAFFGLALPDHLSRVDVSATCFTLVLTPRAHACVSELLDLVSGSVLLVSSSLPPANLESSTTSSTRLTCCSPASGNAGQAAVQGNNIFAQPV